MCVCVRESECKMGYNQLESMLSHAHVTMMRGLKGHVLEVTYVERNSSWQRWNQLEALSSVTNMIGVIIKLVASASALEEV